MLQKSDIGVMDAKAKKLWMIYQQSPKSLSREELQYLAPAIREAYASAKKVYDDLARANPFWHYNPVTGELSTERRDFLRRHLREEDIPQKLDGAVAFHCSEKPFRIASGGNQSTKTYASTVDNLIAATGRVPYCFDPARPEFKWKIPASRTAHDGPQNIRVVGFDWENDVQKNLIPKYRDLAPKEFLEGGSFDKSYNAGERTLYLREKGQLLGTIEFMSNKQDLASFGGPPRRRVCFDEEPFQSVYKENLMRMATSKNFEVVMAFTPVNGISWSHEELFAKWESGDKTIDWFQFCSIANPYVSIQSLEEIVKTLPYEEKKMRMLGEFISLSGLVYGRAFQREIHVIPPFETGCTCGSKDEHTNTCPFAQYLGYLGVDAHMVKASVAALCFIDREDNFYVDTCYKREVNTDEFKLDLNALIGGKRMDWAVFDPSNDSSITAFGGLNIFELVTRGAGRLKIRSFKGEKYQGSIAAGVDVIKKRLQVHPLSKKPRLFIFDRPENQGLIKQFRTMQRDSISNPEAKGQPDRILEGMADEHAAVRYINQNKLVWKDYRPYLPQPLVPDEEAMLA